MLIIIFDLDLTRLLVAPSILSVPPPELPIFSPTLIIISSYTIPSSSPLRRSGDENFHFKGFEELSVQSGWLKNLNGVAVA